MGGVAIGDERITSSCYYHTMTRTEAIDQILSKLPVLSAAQAEALAEILASWTKPDVVEDDATRAAIAEGIAQADRGAFVSAEKTDALLGRPWK